MVLKHPDFVFLHSTAVLIRRIYYVIIFTRILKSLFLVKLVGDSVKIVLDFTSYTFEDYFLNFSCK